MRFLINFVYVYLRGQPPASFDMCNSVILSLQNLSYIEQCTKTCLIRIGKNSARV